VVIKNIKTCFLSLIAFVALSASAPSFGMDIIRNIAGVYIFKAILDKDLSESERLEQVKKFSGTWDVNKITNDNGDTPLSVACYIGLADIVEFLLENACNTLGQLGAKDLVDKFNNEGQTPFHIACINGNKKIAKLLLKFGADINKNIGFYEPMSKKRGYRPTPLRAVSHGFCWRAVQYSPLDIAVIECCDSFNYSENKNYDFGFVRFLLENGADAGERHQFYSDLRLKKYFELVKKYDKAENKMEFVMSMRGDPEAFNLLVKRSFAKNCKSEIDAKNMFDTLKKQLSGVNSAGANNCKKLRDCRVHLLS
jgi:FOG: Ankyrin repeat